MKAYAKAIGGAIVAGVSAFGSGFAIAWQDQQLDTGEAVSLAVAVVVAIGAAFGVVYQVPNKPAS